MNWNGELLLVTASLVLALSHCVDGLQLWSKFRKLSRRGRPVRNEKAADFRRLPLAPRLDNLTYSRISGILPSFRRDAATALLELANYCRQHDLPGVRISLGVAGTHNFVLDATMLSTILQDKFHNVNYRHGVFYKSAVDRRGVGLLTGQGVLLSDGADHMRKRKLILPSMDASSLSQLIDVMNDVAHEYATTVVTAHHDDNDNDNNHDLVQVFGPERVASRVHIPRFTSNITMKIVGLALFSTNVLDNSNNTATNSFVSLADAIDVCLEHVVQVSRRPLLPPLWVPTRRNRRFRRARQQLDDLVFAMIEKGKSNKTRSERIDLLSMLLAARYDDVEHSKLSEVELRDEVMTLYMAGHETTAITLSWALWYLSDPVCAKWQDLIAMEYDKVMLYHGKFNSAALQEPSMMKYTRAVLCEALRIRTPSYAMDREAQQDVSLGNGFGMRQKELAIFSLLALHLDPRHFANPHEFDPTRFLSWTAGGDPWDGPFDRSVYAPFGAGRKRCIGWRFAQWEMLIVLATLCKHCVITRPAQWPNNGDDLRWDPQVTLRTDPALELLFEERK